MLSQGELKVPGDLESGYLYKIPTLGPDIFPDNLLVWDIAQSGSENGKILHGFLGRAGLTKGQRGGVTNLLGSFTRVGEKDLTIGDIRALTEEELIKLRGRLAWVAKPTVDSIKKIKKLLG